ncbi:MAG: 30S ribosomal protein S17e [Thermoplasmataceae archaeon]
MGSIRPQYVKRIATSLVETNPDTFNDDFSHNKKIISVAISGASKKNTNLISGYVTRYVIKKRTRSQKEMEFTGQV